MLWVGGGVSWVSGTSGLECQSSLLTNIVKINFLIYEIGIRSHFPSSPFPGVGIKTRISHMLGK